MYIFTPDESKEANYIFDRQKAQFRKKGFVWCVYFMAYRCDAGKLYEEIRNKWTDLDVVTGKNIAFVIADEMRGHIFGLKGEATRSPYVPRDKRYLFEDTNANMIAMGKDAFGLTEAQIPCLVFCNLLNDNLPPIVKCVNNDVELFSIFRYISFRLDEYIRYLDKISKRISKGYRDIEVYEDMVNRYIAVCRGYTYHGENAKEIIAQLPNAYAEQRLIELWNLAVPNCKKGIYGNSYKSSLAVKIINLRRKNNDKFEIKIQCYYEMMYEVQKIQKEIKSVVDEMDVCYPKQDMLNYGLSKTEELEENINQSKEFVPGEIKTDLKEIRDYFSNEDIFKKNKDWALEKIEAIRTSKFIEIIDNYGRISSIVLILKKLIELMTYIF